MELCISGIGASKGVGMGRILLMIQKETADTTDAAHLLLDPEQTWQSVEAAIGKADTKLQTIRTETALRLSEHEAAIFDAHRMFLSDPMFQDGLRQRILEGMSPIKAVDAVVPELQALFLEMDNDYMRERAEDVLHVGNLLKNVLSGRETPDLSAFSEDVILIAEDLSPAQTVTIDKAHVKGLVTMKGGAASHTAIIARTLEIPAIVGCGSVPETIHDGDVAILDGNTGSLWVHPDPWRVKETAGFIRDMIAVSQELDKYRYLSAVTLDGRHIELAGNIATPPEAAWVPEKGGDGVGLFRTEFLFMDRDTLPTEAEQYKAYKDAADALHGKPLVIRTLDIGGDKPLKNLDLPVEDNPFLGYRAIRICLDRPELFKVQLRAILKASAETNIRIMFPMISSLTELRAAKFVLREAEASLASEGIAFNRQIQVGVMIEIPAACMIADQLAAECDFFSIGTNDLTQYTLAVDRMNTKVAGLYNPLNPGVLRLIDHTVRAAHKANIPVAMCGEMAGDPDHALLLAGLGLDELSMSPSAIPKVKKKLRASRLSEAVLLAEKALQMESAEAVAKLLRESDQ